MPIFKHKEFFLKYDVILRRIIIITFLFICILKLKLLLMPIFKRGSLWLIILLNLSIKISPIAELIKTNV